MAVSLDFLSSQFTKILEELRQLRTTIEIDIDRAENRRAQATSRLEHQQFSDDLTGIISKTMGGFEASWQIGLQEMTERIDAIEQTMTQRFDRIEQLIAGPWPAASEKSADPDTRPPHVQCRTFGSWSKWPSGKSLIAMRPSEG